MLKSQICLNCWVGLLLLGLAGCTGGGPDRASTPPSPSPILATPSPAASVTPTATPTVTPTAPPAASSPTTATAMNPAKAPITVYRLDEQCNSLVPDQVALPPQPTLEATVEAAVGKVIAQSNSPDFTLAGYRVTVANKVATVDLRLPTDAKRPFAAMSSCEQMALFGSLEKTLTSNAALNIQSVKFTSGQKEIVQ
jgi:Sporulation and spore germination